MRELLRNIKRSLLAIYCEVLGFRVVVHWEGDTYIHYARTEAEAREWMRQYPSDCTAIMYGCGHPFEARGGADLWALQSLY